MKKIRNLTIQEIHLENFGYIEIAEDLDGRWKIDLFPRNADNARENILLETNFQHTGDKYFETPKIGNRVEEVYGEDNRK